MLARLKEGREHGSDLFPLDTFDQRAQAGCDIGYIHWHDEVEWVYVAEGAIDVFEDGSTRRVGARELFAVEPRTLRAFGVCAGRRCIAPLYRPVPRWYPDGEKPGARRGRRHRRGV